MPTPDWSSLLPLPSEQMALRDAETANIPFSTVLTGALRRCPSLVWPATPRSERLALHPASTAKNGTLAISASLSKFEVNASINIRRQVTVYSIIKSVLGRQAPDTEINQAYVYCPVYMSSDTRDHQS